MQRNWIGRSEGARLKFPVAGHSELDRGQKPRLEIEVFTTRIDTIYGATFVVLAPEHPLVDRFAAEGGDPTAFRDGRAGVPFARIKEARLTADEKEGIDTGRIAINPFTGEEVPIWIGNFVLAEYGTGAIMAVPAHDERDFEFARKYHLPNPHRRPLEGDAGDGRRPDRCDDELRAGSSTPGSTPAPRRRP